MRRQLLAFLTPLILAACGHGAVGPAPAPTAISAPAADASPDAGDARRARVHALGQRLRQRVDEVLGTEVDSDARWTSAERMGFLGAAPVLNVVFRRQRVDALPVAIYVLSPWQPLVQASRREDMLSARLVTVTEDALVFEPASAVQLSDASRTLRATIEKAVAEVVNLEENQAPRQRDFPVPAGLNVIKLSLHRNHVIVEAAMPGTRMPLAAELLAMAKDRMICLVLTPDTGRKREQWIAPGEAAEIQAAPEPAPTASTFGDYRPKTTPDTVRDYRPALGPRIDELPAAEPARLGDLVRLLDQQAARARQKPGRWIEGRMELGASKREYRPSDDELLESEIGTRIREIASRPDATAALAEQQPKRSEISFREITVTHADVMGSGRYFYSSAPVRTRVALGGR